MADFFGLPSQDAELGLAVHILGSKSRLQYDILDALVGVPMRYAELREHAGARNDESLNRALKALRKEGLIDQRADLEAKVMQYRLTGLGKLVYARMQQMRPHQESIEAYRRGEAAMSS